MDDVTRIVIRHTPTSSTDSKRALEKILEFPGELPPEFLKSLLSLTGRYIYGMSVAQPRSALVNEWREAVAVGETELGFMDWTEQR